MTPVYQTIVGPTTEEPTKRGNCMQAALASLFDLKLDDVPHFIEMGDDWFQHLYAFIQSQGYEWDREISNPRCFGYWGECKMNEIKNLEGVNGYFYAVVYSPKFFEPERYACHDYSPQTHAVIIDRDFNIVHDPNPAYSGMVKYPLWETIGFNGVKGFYNLRKIEKNS